MKMLSLKYTIIVLFLSILINFQSVNAASFNENLKEVRSEINRDNLDEAIKKIKKISISTEHQQEQINILFGDIYLKINQIKRLKNFIKKVFLHLIQILKSLDVNWS